MTYSTPVIQPQVNWQNYQYTAANPAVRQPVTYNQAYNQPSYNTWNPAMNASMQAQMLPIVSRGPGYTELAPFNVPVLNTPGRQYKLDNGQTVIVIPKKGPTTIKTYVKTGSFNTKDEKRGIKHFIEHSLFNGSKGLAPNQFVEKVTGMGGIYNASTDTADTDYYIKSPLHKDGDLKEFLTMHANMLMYPTFSDQMIEKEKGPVISEIQMYQDDDNDKAYNALIKNLFGIKTDYQGLIAGSSKTIKNLTKQDVDDTYNAEYTPDKMTTVIVGDVNPDYVMNIASPLFNRRKAPLQKTQQYDEPLKVTQKTVTEDIYSPNADTEMAVLGFAGPKNKNIKESLAVSALLTAMAGHDNARLTKALKPFNSEPSTDMSLVSSNYNAPQLIQIGANFSPGQQEQGLNTISKVLTDMKYKPLSQQEMFLTKSTMKDSLSILSEDSMDIANLVGQAVSGHGDIRAYTEIEKQVDSLTPQDIMNAAKYLDMNRASVVKVHPLSLKASNTAQTGLHPGQISFGNNSNSDRFKFHHVKEYNLPNNMHVVVNDDPTATRTSADISFRTDKAKTLKPGVSDIFTSMLNKGSKNYSEEELNNIISTYKLNISAGAAEDGINISSNCPKENLPLSIRVMKEILYNPDLSEEKFNKAKEEVKLGYSSIPKNPVHRALEELYPDHPNGITRRKVLEDIDKVTLDDVKKLHQQIISDSQATSVIDGPISKTPGLGNNVFNELQYGIAASKPYHVTPTPTSKSPDQNVVITEAEDLDQANIMQVYKIKESGNIKDRAALILLNEILGGNSNSRLFTDLRETQKLAYRVNSGYNSDGKYGNLILAIKTTTEDDLNGPSYNNLKKSIDGFNKHINRLKTEKVSKDELETAKNMVKTDISEAMQFSGQRADILQTNSNSYYGANKTNEFVDAVDKITSEDIQKAANIYLNKSVISLIASPETIKNMEPYLKSLGKYKSFDSAPKSSNSEIQQAA